jgi:4-hydroxy-tetrahydrodipicolinate reductase
VRVASKAARAVGAPASAGPIHLVLMGASGRMGTQILRSLSEFPALCLAGAVASEHSASLGMDALVRAGLGASGIAITAALPPLLESANLVIDFSSGRAVAASLAACAAARVPLLIGTTGLPPELEGPLAVASRTIALMVAPNTSLGVNMLLELVRRAAAALPLDYDIEIVEAHHRSKRDAPSGTALALGTAVASARGESLAEQACFAHPREGASRRRGQIGFAVVRGGDVVGEHQVLFLGEGERLSLSHSASDRAIFARGALAAGEWLARQPPGRYGMADFLSINK